MIDLEKKKVPFRVVREVAAGNTFSFLFPSSRSFALIQSEFLNLQTGKWKKIKDSEGDKGAHWKKTQNMKMKKELQIQKKIIEGETLRLTVNNQGPW